MKLVAGLAFLLNTVLFATYYSVAKEALGRIDTIVFSFFEMTTSSAPSRRASSVLLADLVNNTVCAPNA